MQQQQPSNTGNHVLFLILSLGIVAAWYYFEQKNAPKPVITPPTQEFQVDRETALMVAGGAVMGDDRFQKLKSTLAAVPAALPVDEPKKEPVAAREPVELIPLGHDADNPYFLRLLISKRGAAVQQVVLTQFQAANREGLGVVDEEGNKVPLHLVPGYVQPRSLTMREPFMPDPLSPGVVAKDVPLAAPSFVMYHYNNSDDDRPLDTLEQRDWKVVSLDNKVGQDEQQIVFETDLGAPHNVRIRKTFSVKRNEYHIGMKIEVTRLEGKTGSRFRYQVDGPRRMPIEGEWYTSTYRNAMTGWTDTGGYGTRYFEDANSIHNKHGSDRMVRADKTIRYAAVTTQFFASAIVVDNVQPNNKDNFVEYVRATPESFDHPTRHYLDDITVRAISEELPLDQPAVHQYLLYQGPIKVRLLRQLETKSGEQAVSEELIQKYHDDLKLNTLTDYQMPGPIGSFASAIMWTNILIASTNTMHWILGKLSFIVPTMGLCIIALTVLVRALLFPLSRKQAVNGVRMQEKMAKMQPELKRAQEKYKNDPQKLRQEQMQLYVKHGVNPLAMMGGCLLLFMQMPIFMGLYYALQESIIFRLAPFLWIPNLAAPDMLIRWGEGIPMISTPDSFGGLLYLGPFLNILPLIAAGLMIVQQRIMMPPAMDEQQAAQQQMMKVMMMMMAFMFYKVAAGLSLYFIASTAWALAERKLLPKKPVAADPNAPPSSGATAMPGTTTGPTPSKAIPVSAVRDRKALMKSNKNKANGKALTSPEPAPKVEVDTSTMMGKLKAWWADILEQAKKK